MLAIIELNWRKRLRNNNRYISIDGLIDIESVRIQRVKYRHTIG